MLCLNNMCLKKHLSFILGYILLFLLKHVVNVLFFLYEDTHIGHILLAESLFIDTTT